MLNVLLIQLLESDHVNTVDQKEAWSRDMQRVVILSKSSYLLGLLINLHINLEPI